MKALLALAWVLVLVTSANAQNSTATVSQTGNNIEGTVDQTGANHQATLTQDAVLSEADPSAVGTITQSGGSGNVAALDQWGYGQSAHITQTGSDNRANLDQVNPGNIDPNPNLSYIEQTGDDNIAEGEIYRHNGHVRQVQTGDRNQAYAYQDVPASGVQGYRSVDQAQMGSDNYALADLTSEALTNRLNQYQDGDRNETRILHFGYGSDADVDQIGDDNKALFDGADQADANLTQRQEGDGNESFIRDFSSHNFGSAGQLSTTDLVTEQYGNSNYVEIFGNGHFDNEVTALQDGNDNSAVVTFNGGSTGATWQDWRDSRNRVTISQIGGDLNVATVTVGSQANTATVMQNGSGNTATITQN